MTLTDVVFAIAVVGSTVGLVALVSWVWWYLSQPTPPALVPPDRRDHWARPIGHVQLDRTPTGYRVIGRAYARSVGPPYDWARDGD